MIEFHYEDRKYQQQAVHQVLRCFKSMDSVLIESPVGSGKTIMGLMVIKALQEEARRKGKTLRVSWVAARHHILDQTERVNEAYFKCDLSYVSAFCKDPPPADLLVVDEAHHEATQSVLNMYENSGNRLTLGLSATPMRTDRMKLSFKHTVKSASISELIGLKILSPYRSYKLSEWAPRHLARIFAEERERWGKSLVFFRTIRECNEFAEAVEDQGISCEVVTGSSDKDRQIDDFLEGRIQIIANVSVLTEGFDVPDLQSVFIRDASRLPTIQMAGRGLRRTPGKEFCNFVQSDQTSYAVEKIARPEHSYRYVNNSWRSLSADTEIILATRAEYQRRIKERNALYARDKDKRQVDLDGSMVLEVENRAVIDADYAF